MADLSPNEAARIVVDAWRAVHGRDPSPSELAFTQAIAWFETRYGRIGQFARLAEQGLYNWGALERGRNADGTCPAGFVEGVDAGNPRCFQVFPSDFEAAKAYIKTLTKSYAKRSAAVLDAMNGGTAEDVAAAMRVAPAYYEGIAGDESAKVNAYAKGIRAGLVHVGKPELAAAGVSLLTLLALGGGAYFLYRRPDIRRRIPLLGRL